MRTSLISATELYNLLRNTNDTSVSNAKSPRLLHVLYTSMQGGPGVKPDIVKEHPNHYIPQSIMFDLQGTFSDQQSKLSNTMIGPEEFSHHVRNLGINNNDDIIIYDDFGNFCASRVWFMFRSMGHKNIKLLDGGLPEWLRLHLPTTNELKTSANTKGNFSAVPDSKFEFVDKHFVLQNIASKQFDIIDARSEARFAGDTPETRKYLRSGHIPQSYNLHYAKIFDEKGLFKDAKQLASLFSAYKKNELVFSCGSGITACILAQAAHNLGVSQVKVYDGSWSEWGMDLALPVENNSR